MIDKGDSPLQEHDLLPGSGATLRYEQDLCKGMDMITKYDRGVTVFGSARTNENNHDYAKARLLGSLLAKDGHVVATGGGGGIMEAANRGAFEAGGVSLGLNIELPHEQHLNSFTTDSNQFKYFFTRKQCLVRVAKAFVYFPGGYGTIDELSEVLVQIQTGKMPHLPVILYDSAFWAPLVEFLNNHLYAQGMISAGDAQIMTITDDIEEIVYVVSTTPASATDGGKAGAESAESSA